ncbi:MAG: phosphatidate cytidylyltransferase [Puniceicoccales bacterium]|jgi:phosphatidate cytidylyltransferase|nr:phosphatidate cytidylyltransferase [Puniceicoccales bacterium]
MPLRILGSAILFVAIWFCLWAFGQSGAVLIMAFFAIGSQIELCRLMKNFHATPARRQLLVWTAVIIFGSWYLRPMHAGIWLSVVAAVWILVCGVAKLRPEQLLNYLAPTLFAIFYVPFSMQFGILLLRSCESGTFMLGWTVLVSKLGDIGGLIVGGGIGRHPLAAEYSPKKTWEGFFGAIAAATAGGFSLCILASWFCDFPIPLWLSMPLGAIIAAVGAAADLLESALKRHAKIKDSGRIIPGIGGCLDLCDSLFLTLPTTYAVLEFFL